MKPFTKNDYDNYIIIKKIKKINPKRYNEIEYFTRLYLTQKEDIFWEETNFDEEFTFFDKENLKILKNKLKSMRKDFNYMYYKKYKSYINVLNCLKG